MPISDVVRAKQILNLERIDNSPMDEWQGIYTLGIASRPALITVSCQQNRAADLVRSIAELLQHSPKPPPNVRVGIIGGGIAGLSMGMLFQDPRILKFNLKSKFKVRLYEKHNLLCPIQRGCSIRRLHPYIHEWPFSEAKKEEFFFSEYKKKSERKQSPMFWSAGSSQDVSKSIVSSYFAKFPELSGNGKDSLEAWQDVSYLHVNKSPSSKSRYMIVADGRRIVNSIGETKQINEEFHCDIVVFATGFGAEDRYSEPGRSYAAVSYWRNDDRGQASLYGQAGSYIVSGGGDGGLTDVLRLKLLDYQQDATVLDVFPLDPNEREYLAHTLAELHLPAEGDNKKRKAQVKKIEHHLSELISSLREIRKRPHNEHFDALVNEWRKNISYGYATKKWGALELLARYLLEPKLRSDVSVILRTGTPTALREQDSPARKHLPIEGIVCNGMAAFYNRVLIFMIWKLSALKVVHTDTLDEVQRQYDVPDSRVIIRHGVNTISAIKQAMSESLLISRPVDLSKPISTLPPRVVTAWETALHPKLTDPPQNSVEDYYRSGRRAYRK